MLEDVYRSRIDHVSVSELKTFIESPYKYKWQYLEGNKPEFSKAKGTGTLFHLAYLEPHRWEQDVRGFSDLRTADARRWREQGKIAVRNEEYDSISAAARVLRADARINDLMQEPVIEQSFFWEDPDTAVKVKGRLDSFCAKTHTIVDIKTTQSLKTFKRDAYGYGYDLQAAFYTDALRHCLGAKDVNFIFVAIELKAPYLYKVFHVDPALITEARATYKHFLGRYKEALATNNWQHPSDETEILGPRNNSNIIIEEM